MRFSTTFAILAAPFLVSAAPAKYKRATDADILVLQFAEVLEQLESEFYAQALTKFQDQDYINAGIGIPDVAKQNFQNILAHEQQHTAFLGAALETFGASPVQGCTFNFDSVLTDVATMAAVARVVEAVGVGAYMGAAPLLTEPDLLLAAASILTTEARHQSFLNTINSGTNVPQAFDIALTPQQVLSLAGDFISGCSFEQLTPTPKLVIANEGPVGPGTLLTFSGPELPDGLTPDDLSCQMVVGGASFALSFPLKECIVPEDVNGPVLIFLTRDQQPLSTNIRNQNADSIIAGPAYAFIDSISDVLGALLRQSGPVGSGQDIAPGDASSLIGGAPPAPTYGDAAPSPVEDPAAPPTPPANVVPEPPAGAAVVVIGTSVIPIPQ